MQSTLAQRLVPTPRDAEAPRPVFFQLAREDDQQKLALLLDQHGHIAVIDRYEEQLKELFVLQNPWLHLNPPERDKQFTAYRDAHVAEKDAWQAGVWAYLPWRHVLIHLLDDASHQQVRTARNRNLITAEEQERYYRSTIGIAGLSVGNSCALAIVLTGGGKHLRLADPDTLELTNLNRIRGSIAEITSPKVYMTARQIYELDPYADLTLFTDGLTEDNIQRFFDGPPALDVVIDEIDNLGMKVRIRQEAKKRRLPVVMAADNGDSGVLDIERHDLEDNIPFFHGRAGEDIAERVVGKKLSLPEIGRIITEDLIGADIVTPRMQQSLLAIGFKIPTWPQLGGAALLNGVAVAAAVRMILTGQSLIRNRAVFSVESLLIPDYESEAEVAKRREATQQFRTAFRELLAKAAAPH